MKCKETHIFEIHINRQIICESDDSQAHGIQSQAHGIITSDSMNDYTTLCKHDYTLITCFHGHNMNDYTPLCKHDYTINKIQRVILVCFKLGNQLQNLKFFKLNDSTSNNVNDYTIKSEHEYTIN